VKAELDPSETPKPTPTSLSLKVLGVAFVLFCVIAAGSMIWGVTPVSIDAMIKITATFILLVIGLIAVLYLTRKKNS
jgi:membrane protein YdbS with pleckstrin-like domain